MVNEQEAVVALYQYDPFGNPLSMSGPLAQANLYRFSSKELHKNSGLTYYLYRYYDASLQRWLNRDPIGELGGINLYGLVGNDPVNVVDLFGLAEPPGPFPSDFGDLAMAFTFPGGSLDVNTVVVPPPPTYYPVPTLRPAPPRIDPRHFQTGLSIGSDYLNSPLGQPQIELTGGAIGAALPRAIQGRWGQVSIFNK